jgi:diacylglycerol kinase (ATP)
VKKKRNLKGRIYIKVWKVIKNIPNRAKKASYYSICGLISSFKKEEAIKLETIALVVLIIVMCLVTWTLWKKVALVGIYLLIPLTELLNSAIEDICDLISTEYNEKIKNAKDKGSAAVLIAIFINFIALAALILI